MKRVIIYILFLFLAWSIVSCKNKYELTSNAYEIKYKDYYSNSIAYEGEYYYLFTGKVLLASSDKKSKVTLCNIYYDEIGNVTRVENTRTIIFDKGKTYPITFTITKQNTTKSGSIVEFISMRQGIYVYENYSVIVDASYN